MLAGSKALLCALREIISQGLCVDAMGDNDGRGVKRSWEDWRVSEFRAYFAAGPVVIVNPEVIVPVDTVLVVTKKLLDKFDTMVASWTAQPDEKTRRALLILAFCVEEETLWNKTNDVLTTRIFGLLFAKEYRAHPDGVYTYLSGAH